MNEMGVSGMETIDFSINDNLPPMPPLSVNLTSTLPNINSLSTQNNDQVFIFYFLFFRFFVLKTNTNKNRFTE